jgi:excisionase family DNA binding protein
MQAVELQNDEPLAVPQRDAARLLRVDTRTIRRWEAAGLIRGTKVGGVRLYPFEALKALAGIGGGRGDTQ